MVVGWYISRAIMILISLIPGTSNVVILGTDIQCRAKDHMAQIPCGCDATGARVTRPPWLHRRFALVFFLYVKDRGVFDSCATGPVIV